MALTEVLAFAAVIALWMIVALSAVATWKVASLIKQARESLTHFDARLRPLLGSAELALTRTDEQLSKLEEFSATQYQRLSTLTEEQEQVTRGAKQVSEQAARLAELINESVAAPLIRTVSIKHGVRAALKGRRDT